MIWSQDIAVSEHLKPKENQDQYQDSDPLVCQKLVNEMGEQEVVTGDLSSEIKQEETPEVNKNLNPSDREITDSLSIENQTQIAEGGNLYSVIIQQDVTLEYEPSKFTGTPTEGVAVIPYDGVTAHMNAADDSSQLRNEDKGSSDKRRKGKAKKSGPVVSSWSLRTKFQQKPKYPEPSESVKELDVDRENEKRVRKRKLTSKSNSNEFSRTKTHLRYLLRRIQYEQNMVDAYSTEGWKGQSLEKLKPEKELQRAKSHILRYKMKIRALFEQLDRSLAVGKLPESLFDSKGEIDSEDIFCAKCGSKDLTLDNDIILCDGACTRGFHQYCLEPPLLKEDIPPGDEGWICPGCDCKLDCIDTLKDFHNTKVSITDSWENIFPEAARAPSENNLDTVTGLSDDSDDDDYDPDKPVVSPKDDEDQPSPDESGYFSAPDDLPPSHDNEIQPQDLPSDDSEDGEFDPSAVHQEKATMSDSSDFTSDSEDLGALHEDEIDLQNLLPNCKQHSGKNFTAGVEKTQSLTEELSSLQETTVESVSGKRHVGRLDYKKLHDEAYANYSSDSSDEDFDESSANKDSPGTMDENVLKSSSLPKRTRRRIGDTGSGEQLTPSGSTEKSCARPSTYKRLGDAVTEKLYSSFLENKYPDRSVKEKFANELGITLRQVSKWFENARWSFNHSQRQGSTTTHKPPDHLSTPDTISNHSSQMAGLQDSRTAVAFENNVAEEGVEASVRRTTRNGSGSIKRRGRKRGRGTVG